MPKYIQEVPCQLSKSRRETLDFIKGLASLLIFVFHFFALYPSGPVVTFGPINHVILNYFAMGVPLFFSLSGLSLYIGYRDKHANPGFVKDFYLRRLFRILPLFYIVTLCWFLIFYSRGATPAFEKVASTLSFIFNLIPERHESLVAAGWSVGVEMLFYVVFPIIVARIYSIRSSMILLVGTCVTSVFSFKYLTTFFPGSTYPELSIFSHGHFFAGGIAVYWLAGCWFQALQRIGKFGRLMPCISFCAGVISICILTSIWFGNTFSGLDRSVVRVLWVIPIMFLLFSACIVKPSQPWIRPFVKLGEWSFSLYLLHPLILYFLFEPLRENPAIGQTTAMAFLMHLCIGLMVLIVCSAVTYRWIEKPGIRLGRFILARDQSFWDGKLILSRFKPETLFFCVSSKIRALELPTKDQKNSSLTMRWSKMLALAALGFILYTIFGDRPLVAEPWQWADDGLYLRQSEAFVRWIHGDATKWLGPYDPILLSKAPLFSIWIGLVNLLKLPLRLAEFVILLPLPWLFRAAVRPMLDLSGWRLMPIIIILIGLPFLPQEQRLLRSTLHVAVASGCLISAVGMILRARFCDRRPLYWGVLTGFLFALSYLNREETIWLLPVVGLALLALAISAMINHRWHSFVLTLFGVISAFAIPVVLVTMLNYQAYGISVTTTRRAPAFTEAYQLMTSLEPNSRERFVPITAATRIMAYKLSPTMAQLQPYLEGPVSDSIAMNPGHLALNGRAAGTREFFVSNFEFVLRDAAFAAGAHTASSSEAMFKKITSELEAGIEAGKITAGEHGPSLMAAPIKGDNINILGALITSLKKLYLLDGMVYPRSGISTGSRSDLDRMAILTNNQIAPTMEMGPIKMHRPNFRVRSIIFSVVTYFLFIAYIVGTLSVFAFFVCAAIRHRRNNLYLEQGFVGFVLCGSVFVFSFAMAVVHVLGFPMLKYSVPYNCMGYIPLSVLSAFGVSITIMWLNPKCKCNL
jgi:peptidoglycan/LPS O-acetylase OafA/YrhL